MTPEQWDRFRQLPRAQILELARRILPAEIANADEPGIVVYQRPPTWDDQSGAVWLEKIILPPADYGPPGDSVFGDFRASYYPDSAGNWSGPFRLVTFDFFKRERSGSWFAENLDTIGPLAVRLFSMAAGAGWLPLPFAEPVEAAGLIAYTPPPVTENAAMFDFFDAPADLTPSLPDFSTPFVPGEEMIFNPEDISNSAGWVSGEELMSGPAMDPTAPPAPPPVAQWVSGEELPPGGGGWVSGEELSSGGTWTGDPTAPPAPPTTAPPAIQPPPAGSPVDLVRVFNEANSGLKAAISALMTARQLINVVQNPRAVTPTGQSRTVNPNGTVTVRTPDGRVSVTRPRPGVMEMATDGGYILNNGNGTYTRIGADGSSQTFRYDASSGMGSFSLPQIGNISLPVLLLLAGGAYFLLRKK